ncbi:MAG: hypothetical protein WC809_09965 [Sinimarinibacterium sp.]|jgi:hypothetical protein
MARKENQIETVQFTISTTGKVVGLLRALVDTGLFGKNQAEAAERLIAQSLAQLIHEKRLILPSQE